MAENAMIAAFRASADSRPPWSLVADLGGVIVGHVLVAPVSQRFSLPLRG